MRFFDQIFSGWDFLDDALNQCVTSYVYGDGFSSEIPNAQHPQQNNQIFPAEYYKFISEMKNEMV